MLTASEVSDIKDVIDDKIKNQVMFTAYDITTIVRAYLKVKHSTIRDIVHDYFTNGDMTADYTRTNVQSPSGGTYLYHPTTSDPNSYTFKGATAPAPVVASTSGFSPINTSHLQPTVPTNTPVQPSPFLVISSIPNQSQMKNRPNAIKGRVADGRGTYSVPVNLLKMIGLSATQKAYVKTMKNKLEITSTVPDSTYRTYTVDKSNQVRIPKCVFVENNILGKCDFVEENNKIVVTSS